MLRSLCHGVFVSKASLSHFCKFSQFDFPHVHGNPGPRGKDSLNLRERSQNGELTWTDRARSDDRVLMFRAIVFFGLIKSAFASATLDVLVNAAASFPATIQQQLEMLQS